MPKRAIVIGSGFGGAVTACRLAQAVAHVKRETGEAPFQVVLLERGRRYGKEDFPRLQLPESMTSNPDLKSSQRLPDFARYSWRTDYGLYDARNLGGLMVLQAAGLGGGSLIYANVMLRAPERVLSSWPACYQPNQLNAYYDLAEFVLGATPAPDGVYAKTANFERAVTGLGREVVKVPLAINFPKPRQDRTPLNRYGVAQGECNGCGDCVIGCKLHAKNTLDLNYIAQFDAIAQDNPDVAETWTMAEVTHLRRRAPDQSSGFLVTLIHHDQGEQERELDADYVFLCAGAVGTTELLMNSWNDLQLGPKKSTLGKRLYGNGDSLGVAFDTEKPSSPWSGPTITRAMAYAQPARDGAAEQAEQPERAADDETWFLVQDGGIPPTLRHMLGYFRAGMWLGRNRFATPQAHGAVRPSFGPLTDLFLDLPVLAGIFSRRSEPVARRDEEPWRNYVPKDFLPLVRGLTHADGQLRREIEALDKRVMQRLQAELGRRYGLASWLPSFSNIINTSVLTESVLGALRDRFPVVGYLPKSGKLSEGLLQLAAYLLLGHGTNANSAVFLCMGPDHEWRLRHRNGLLRADRDRAGSRRDVALYGAQERVLRDLNEQMRGELRTNPSWTIGQRPITVHVQGGAGMPRSTDPDPATAITNERGQVQAPAGSINLYVMDAAGFPTSVGVNPSLTIAAVAEYKVEKFIQTELGLANWSNREQERNPTRNEANAGLIERALEAATQDTKHQAVGIFWHERMDGSASASALAAPNARDCVIADKRGLKMGRHLGFELDCHIADLEAFYLQKSPEVRLTGSLSLRTPSGEETHPCSGTLRLGLKLGRLQTMNYELVISHSKPEPREIGRLVGTKFIHDDPGLDAFIDLTTLHCVLTLNGEQLAGVVRVPMATFLSKQLPTFELTNVDDLDNTGKLWATARFSQFFFGTIKETFMPELFVQKQLRR